MTSTLYASFNDISDAERATGALMDHGLKAEDVSLLAHENHAGRYQNTSDDGETKEDASAKSGISTTTPADAGVGAAKGAGIGLGVGVAAALVSLLVPGVGLVLGGGALAIAAGGAVGATAAGAAAGGAFGYLKDQGVPEQAVATYKEAFDKGGAVLAIHLNEKLTRTDAEALLSKYNAQNMNEY